MRICTGAGLTDPQVDAKLWVDAKTRMPVRVEAVASGLTGGAGRMSSQILLRDFDWNLPVTEDEFEPPPVPDGYLLVVDKVPGWPPCRARRSSGWARALADPWTV